MRNEPALGPFAFHKHRGAGTGKSQLTIAVVAPLTTAGDPLAASADRSRVHVVSAVRNADGSRCAPLTYNVILIFSKRISRSAAGKFPECRLTGVD
jgi:hypothetical protein